MPLETLELDKITTLEEALSVIRELVREVVVLRAENLELRSENKILRERIARLEKNSSNSSKPPSSDITKPPEEQRQTGKRKVGWQPGHKGSWRLEFGPEEIDRRKELKAPVSCPDCKTTLQPSSKVKIHQQAELVEKPVLITEYQLRGGRCPCCNKIVYAALPPGVIAGQMMGPKMLTLFGYMKAAMGVSISELAAFSTDALKFRTCRAAVQNAIFQVSDALQPTHEELAQAVPGQKALHVDETGWKENGNRQWVWLFCNNFIAFFVISKSRACQVLKEVLGENFLGALTSDFYSAYVKYASPKQQFCLAHLIREIKFLLTLPDELTKKFARKLLAYMRRLFRLWHTRRAYSPELWQKKTTRFKRDLQTYLFLLSFQKGTDAYRTQRRLIKHWPALFRFLDSPELYEPTNNLAERTVRFLVQLRRVSQGSRGTAGANWTARAASVVATCRLQQRSVWNCLSDAVNSKYLGTLPPSLINA